METMPSKALHSFQGLNICEIRRVSFDTVNHMSITASSQENPQSAGGWLACVCQEMAYTGVQYSMH